MIGAWLAALPVCLLHDGREESLAKQPVPSGRCFGKKATTPETVATRIAMHRTRQATWLPVRAGASRSLLHEAMFGNRIMPRIRGELTFYFV